VDVTADVDFSVCARAAVNNGATVLPLATQGEYLMRMGVVERVEQLVNSSSTTDEQAEVLVESLRRLIDPAEMGRKYKVLSITSPGLKVPGFD
jgi:NADH dehydrogenase [ubiquinone] 1 alpha subcomplex assembly factor 7